MQLIFDRRVTRRTPGRFRTRVLTEGVVPSLHVEYKKSKVKQYHKEGQALRTETTINDTYDFAIGRALRNLPALREIGFAANRRLLHVESLSHDCLIGEDHLHAVTSPVLVHDQRAAGLRFGDRRVHALMHALCLFALAPTGFRHREFRDHVAQLQSRDPATYSGRLDDLRPPAPPAARPHRTGPAQPSLSHHADRRAGRHVLRASLCQGASPRLLACSPSRRLVPSAPSIVSMPPSPNSWRR